MNQSITMGRLALLPRVAISIVALLVLLSGFLFAAQQAKAAAPRDSLIKVAGPSSTLYYLSLGGSRYVFPNEGVFYSWFTGFEHVYEVTIDELTTYPLAGNVTYRPGIRLVKIQTDPKVYAVARGGVLRWITSETVAQRLYGSDWNKKVDDVPDAFFVNYVMGDPIYSDSDYDPLDEADAADSIGADKGLPVGQNPHRGDTVPDVGNAAAIRQANPQSCQVDTWTCGSWSSCPQGLQTRSCVKSYDCPGVDTLIPETARSCNAEQSCTADTWSCGGWTTCNEQSYQTRSCEMTYDCPQHQTPSPSTGQTCTPPAEPFVHVEITNGVSSSTVAPGASNVSMLEFEILPENTDFRVFNISAFGWIDANNDGVFARTEENGVRFDEVVDACAIFDGQQNLVGYRSVGETYHGDAMVGAPLLSENYYIYNGEPKTLTFKCNILDTAGEHAVALVFEAQETVGGVQGLISGSDMLTHESQTAHPINGDGVDSAGIVVSVVDPVAAVIPPTVNIVSLPSSLLSAGNVTAMRFAVSAPGEAVSLRHLTFESSLHAGALTSIVTTTGSSIRELGSPSNISGTTRMNNGVTCITKDSITCVIEVGFADDVIIPAGGSRNFELRLVVDGASTVSDSLATRILGDGVLYSGSISQSGGAWDYRVHDGNDNFVWFDRTGLSSGSAAPASSTKWRNGFGILVLPTAQQVLAN